RQRARAAGRAGRACASPAPVAHRRRPAPAAAAVGPGPAGDADRLGRHRPDRVRRPGGGMTTFADWLALREPADAAARSAELVDRLALRPPLLIHDLGSG